MIVNNLGMFNYYSTLWNNNINSSQLNFPFASDIQNSVVDSLKSAGIFSSYKTNYINFDNIIKLNSTSTIKTDAENLLSSAKTITDIGTKGVFSAKTAVSQDSTKITAAAENGAYNTTYSLEVNQLAKTQVNTSNTLDKQQVSGINAGTNTFTIKMGSTDKNITFTTAAGDTNETALNKMAKAINDGNAGVTATIIKDTNGIKIQLTAKETGENNKFTITDKTGNAAAYTGISNISTAAVNAQYKLNNITYTSNSNEVTTDKGKVTFNLKNITTNPVKITIKQDSNKIESAIENFANNYNTIINDAIDNDINSNSINGMAVTMKNNKSNLANMGITINNDYTISVDKTKLLEAIETDGKLVKDTFASYQGIARKVENFSASIVKNPFTAAGINTFDVYNKNLLMASTYAFQGYILNLYR